MPFPDFPAHASRHDTICSFNKPSHASQWEGPSPPPPCRISLCGPSAVCRNDQAVKALAGFWLSDRALDRTVKGSALIKYNSTETAVSSVNLDEQRMNWFGREARERERERGGRFKRGSPTVPGLRIFSIDRLSRVSGPLYIGHPFQSARIDC